MSKSSRRDIVIVFAVVSSFLVVVVVVVVVGCDRPSFNVLYDIWEGRFVVLGSSVMHPANRRGKVHTQSFSACFTAGNDVVGVVVSFVFGFSDTLFSVSTSSSLSRSMSISSPENPKLNADAML